MRQSGLCFLFTLVMSCVLTGLRAQELSVGQSVEVPDKFYVSLLEKSSSLSQHLDKSMEKYLGKIQKQEQKLRVKMWKQDSTLTKQLFAGIEEKYADLKKAPQGLSKYNQVYSGHLDCIGPL